MEIVVSGGLAFSAKLLLPEPLASHAFAAILTTGALYMGVGVYHQWKDKAP